MKKSNGKLLAGILVPLALAALVLVIYFGSGEDQVKQGRQVYEKHCANCHGASGEGLQRLIPPLTRLDHLTTAELVCIIRYGRSGPIQIGGVEYNQPMPANKVLENDEITALVNYLYREMAHIERKTGLPDVNKSLDSCP